MTGEEEREGGKEGGRDVSDGEKMSMGSTFYHKGASRVPYPDYAY